MSLGYIILSYFTVGVIFGYVGTAYKVADYKNVSVVEWITGVASHIPWWPILLFDHKSWVRQAILKK